MGKTADKATRQAEEQAAALLSEPLLGIGMVNRCGVMGTIAANTALDIADAFLPGELPGGIVASDPQQRQVMMFEIMKSDYAREFGSLLRSG